MACSVKIRWLTWRQPSYMGDVLQWNGALEMAGLRSHWDNNQKKVAIRGGNSRRRRDPLEHRWRNWVTKGPPSFAIDAEPGSCRVSSAFYVGGSPQMSRDTHQGEAKLFGTLSAILTWWGKILAVLSSIKLDYTSVTYHACMILAIYTQSRKNNHTLIPVV